MPIAHVRGVNLNYEVLGSAGPWVALSPGGRRGLDNVKSLAQHVADAGCRVLIHDRRNCGLSDIAIGADVSEYEVWAEDLYDLLSQLKARPANRATLMAMDPNSFIAAMERWRGQFAKGAELPIIGASEKDLNSIKVPTCIIPGNDKTHNHAIAETAHRMIAGSELYDLFPGDLDGDLA